YTVVIDGTGTPDTFKWKLNSGSFTTGVAITGASQTLSNGVTVTFAATTGHALNDQWTIQVQPNITTARDVHTAIGIRFECRGILDVNWGSYVSSGGLPYRSSLAAEDITGMSAEQSIDATGSGCGNNGSGGTAQSCDTQASYVTFFSDNNNKLFVFF